MNLAHLFEHYLLLALGILAAVIALVALFDAVRHPAANFQRENKRSKPFWMGMTAAATLVCVLSVLGGGGGGIFQLVGACIACVYLADVKPAVSGKGGYSY
ncbi:MULTISPECIES: DUF2516 family protein [Paeniglutamicibacter]|uniref:Membrane protein YfcA n=1 Tax=Paeniglutamicibacter sulfureus TaxID=43666 RepID=A0ABU2BH30_9MICC|nr:MULTISPECIES: DUF2516 family protein [Paeniglutamicibacter]MCV9995940.1 DUF2516 family protein [Paeniglutamicibacter sp. ZC-3]MDO2933537.1 DUF2516 family protein [Paeniglutamicibacter sulfureus]MDR7357954.1 putative membrane protein YfcA [Paeniglutamicibacter sulfureus]